MVTRPPAAVVIPARDEAAHIQRTLATVPAWVEQIWVVDDASRDATAALAESAGDPRVAVLRHATHRGVGAAIVTGYRAAAAGGAAVIAVMAGDGQMDGEDLAALIAPLAEARADYVKGNRFLHPERERMPRARRWAGRALGRVTSWATGLAVDDPQCGYTAIAAPALRQLDLEDLWPRYGYPNDLLALLAAAGLRVVEVPVRPIYADEHSGVRPWHVLVICGLLARRVAQRWARRLGHERSLALRRRTPE